MVWLFGVGCSTHRTTPSENRPPALVAVMAFPEQYREPARAVAKDLSQQGEEPKDFFTEIEPGEGGQTVVFHLWHKSAFEPQNAHMLGNPGGKCRDVWYDLESGKVTQTLFWQ